MLDVHIDIETYYDDEYSLKKLTTTEYILDDRFVLQMLAYQIGPMGERNVASRTDGDLDVTLDLLRNLPRPWRFVGQNTKFDGAVLAWRYGIVADAYADTMSMSQGMFPGAKANLEDLAVRLFPTDTSIRKSHELTDTKGVMDWPPALNRTMKGYNKNDVKVEAACFYEMLRRGFPQDQLDLINIVLLMYIKPQFVLNRELMQQAMQDDAAAQASAIARGLDFVHQTLRQLDMPTWNPSLTDLVRGAALDGKLFGSNERYAKLLTEVYELETPTKVSKTTGRDTHAFGKKDVPYIQFKDNHPELAVLFEAREASKSTISVTRAQRFLDNARICEWNPEGRLPVPLKYYGAHTGRLSGADKINMQNMPRNSKHRLALTAPKGCLVYVKDLSNIEARMNAAFAGQDDLVEAFRLDMDIYSDFAATVVYNRPVIKGVHKNERNVGKTAILGLGYGMSWFTFMMTLLSGPMGAPPIPCDREMAMTATYGYRARYPMIVKAWSIAEEMLMAMMSPNCDIPWGPLRVLHNCILLPNGMFLAYPGLKCEHEEQQDGTYRTVFRYWNGKFWASIYGGKLIENIVQALSAIPIQNAMREMHHYIVDNRWVGSVALQVHDELVCIGPDFDGDEKMQLAFDQRFTEAMTRPLPWMPQLPMAAEGGFDVCYSK